MAGNAERLALVASGAVRIVRTFEQSETAARAAAAAAPAVEGWPGKLRPREYRGWSRENPGPYQAAARAQETREKRDGVYRAAVSGDAAAARRVLDWEISRMRGGAHDAATCEAVPAGVPDDAVDMTAAGHPAPWSSWIPAPCGPGVPVVTLKGKGETVTAADEKTARTKRARAAAAVASAAGDSPEAVRLAASEAYRAALPASVPGPVAAPAAAAAVGPAGNGGNVGQWLNVNREAAPAAPARDVGREAMARLEAGRLDAESRAEAAAEKRGRKVAPVAVPVAAAPVPVPASVPAPVVIPAAPGIVPNAAPVLSPDLGGALRF